MKQHIQNAAPHQHPNNIGMKEDWGNFSIVEELLENGRKGKAKPRIELLLGEIHGVILSLLYRPGTTLH